MITQKTGYRLIMILAVMLFFINTFAFVKGLQKEKNRQHISFIILPDGTQVNCVFECQKGYKLTEYQRVLLRDTIRKSIDKITLEEWRKNGN